MQLENKHLVKLKELINKLALEEDGEAAATGNTTSSFDIYNTPNAFSKGKDQKKRHDKKLADLAHGQVVAENRWLQLKSNSNYSPKQKIGFGIREVRKQIDEIEKFMKWYGMLKHENNLSNESFWKRTNNHIYKIKERLGKLGNRITELEQDPKKLRNDVEQLIHKWDLNSYDEMKILPNGGYAFIFSDIKEAERLRNLGRPIFKAYGFEDINSRTTLKGGALIIKKIQN